MVSVTLRPHYRPGERTPVPIVQEAGWASEPVWTQSLEEKSFHLCRGSNLDLPVVQHVARHWTTWATRLISMLYSLSYWEASLNKLQINIFYKSRSYITVYTRRRHWSPSWPSWMHFTSLHTTSLRSILILSFHLHLILRGGLFPSFISKGRKYCLCSNKLDKLHHLSLVPTP
jgi:hypothetical protein